MTIIGILLVAIGAAVGLTSPIAYNGQWLRGVLSSVIGVALVIAHATITLERKNN